MLHQGTVLGPPLCNIFLAEASLIDRILSFTDIGCGEDLNVFKGFDRNLSNNLVCKEFSEALAHWNWLWLPLCKNLVSLVDGGHGLF